jgi:hypothetical protein
VRTTKLVPGTVLLYNFISSKNRFFQYGLHHTPHSSQLEDLNLSEESGPRWVSRSSDNSLEYFVPSLLPKTSACACMM